MKKIFGEYGRVIVVVIATICIIALISVMMSAGGMRVAFGSIAGQLSGKTNELIGTNVEINVGSGGAGGNGGGVAAPGRTTPQDLGEVTWDDLIASSEDGSYATKYVVGDTMTLTLKDSSKSKFRIVGIDHDDLADGSGKAPLSLMSEDTLFTGTEGDALSYLQGNPVIPDEAFASVKTVRKTTNTYDYDTDTCVGQVSEDKLWIPSCTEVGITAYPTILDNEGGSAYAYFKDDASRVKVDGNGAASWWWLRSVVTYDGEQGTLFTAVGEDGTVSTVVSYAPFGLAFGFCI